MESVEELYKHKNFWSWNKYIPKENHYVDFDSNVVAAFFKIEDLINIYSKARFSLGLLEVQNYGELISTHDENHLNFIRSYFIQDAIVYYNIAIDMAWQVIFFYITDSTDYFLANHEEYRKHADRCNRTNLIELMKMYEEKELKEIEDNFFNNEIVLKLRKTYNAYKHKSSFHIKGLGEQYSSFMVGVKLGENDVDLNMFTREEIDIQEMRGMLINFDIKFFDYFNSILQIITPKNFEESLNKSVFDLSTENIYRLYSYAQKVDDYKKNELEKYKYLFDIAYYDTLDVDKKKKIILVDN